MNEVPDCQKCGAQGDLYFRNDEVMLCGKCGQLLTDFAGERAQKLTDDLIKRMRDGTGMAP